MKIAGFAARRRAAVLVLFLAAVVFGMISCNRFASADSIDGTVIARKANGDILLCNMGRAIKS